MNVARSARAFHRTFGHALRSHHDMRAFPLRAPRTTPPTHARPHSTDAGSRPARPLTDRAETCRRDAEAIAARKAAAPAYQLHFTCKKCLTRSAHTVSRQAYHFGTTVIHCPHCRTQHLISDHLRIFSDRAQTLDDIAREHGELLRKGRLGVHGDVEFYDDLATRDVHAHARRVELGLAEARARLRGEGDADEQVEGDADQPGEGDADEQVEAATGARLAQSVDEQAMDDRIRDALRATSRRQHG